MLRSWLGATSAPLIGWMLVNAPTGLAQSSGSQPPPATLVFEGGVTSGTGADVANATVVVTGPGGAWRAVRTNQFGQFGAAGPYVAGTYTVTATEGKRTVSDTISVPAAPGPPDDRAARVQTFVVNLAFDGGSKVTGAYLIPVYFATSRRQIAASPPRYGNEANGQDNLTFGIANVSVPLRHKVGRIDRAWWEFLANGDKHIIVIGGDQLSAQQFQTRARAPKGDEDALVFVHGFNVTFREALETAAQVAYDIGFRGAVILYSWPSGSVFFPLDVTETRNQYTFAQAQIDQGAEYVRFASFLQDVAGAHKGRVHLLAHSMGAYLSVRSFKNVKPPMRWTNVMFAAPDVSQAVFNAEAPSLVALARVLTIYFNPNDRALTASKAQNWNFPRTGASCTRYQEVDCIDASNLQTSLTRHSYYADNRSVLSDIRLVTCLQSPPAQRALQPTKVANAWVVGKVPAAQPKECGP